MTAGGKDHELDWMVEPNPFMIFLSPEDRKAVKNGRKKLMVYRNVPILEETECLKLHPKNRA